MLKVEENQPSRSNFYRDIEMSYLKMLSKELKILESSINQSDYSLKLNYSDLKNSLKSVRDKATHLSNARQLLLQKNLKHKLERDRRKVLSLMTSIGNLFIILRIGNQSINLNEIIAALGQVNYIAPFQTFVLEIFKSLVKVGIMPENVDLSSIRNDWEEMEISDHQVSEVIEEIKNVENQRSYSQAPEDLDDIRLKLKALL